MSPPMKKILLILTVMLCSYAAFLIIIKHSKSLSLTNSEATEYTPKK